VTERIARGNTLFFDMNQTFVPPISHIGEPDWANKLQQYLEANDITCIGESLATIERAEATLELSLPWQLKEYYLRFGTTSTSDYMYNLRPITDFVRLFATNWSFITFNFRMSEINTMVVFAESPGNDPLCFDFKTGAIYLFSHDPVKKAKVFTDFSQYVVHELFEAERLVGSHQLNDDDITKLTKEYLSGEDIDYAFRQLKL
jgi:hypothetical protein